MEQTGLFNLGMATGLGEGKLQIQKSFRFIEVWASFGYSGPRQAKCKQTRSQD